MMRRSVLLLLGASLSTAAAQQRGPTQFRVHAAALASDRSQSLGFAQASERPPRASAWSIAASAALPGAGQALLGVDRFVPYLAFEGYSWAQYATHSGDSRRRRADYRALAAHVARAAFTSVVRDGTFEYYERMEHFLESGAFERVPGGILDPEPDTTTYNGSVWLLARRTYWRDVNVVPDTSTQEWKAAAGFYRLRAYSQSYRWSWRSAQLEYDEFRRLIRRSNDANRKSLQNLGAIIANHMLSAVDAYITVRLRRHVAAATPGGGWQLEATVPVSNLRR